MITTMGRHTRAPLTGYLADEASQGAYWDAWVETHAQIAIRLLVPILGMVLRGWRPDSSPGARIHIAIKGESAGVYPIGDGSFACRVRPSRHLRGHLFGLAATGGRANRSAASGQGQELV